jgi:cytoskeletal protein RodZ
VGKINHKTGGIRVKKAIIGLVCALLTPLAFAQTSTTTSEETTTSTKPATTTSEETTTSTKPATTTEETTTSTTYTAGTVTTYEPGKTVVVKSDQGPVSFALGTAARVVDGAGKVGADRDDRQQILTRFCPQRV